mmetsp:Transcript_109330/g.309276  ORF Transcript_109330/g.309276 Transcript_109330/m.309276 type:complete len:200 (+) Transcript_109330:240-839(+)
MAPSSICIRGFWARLPQSSSSWMCDVHISNDAALSWMGSTVRGGPGTRSFLLMEASKHSSSPGSAAPAVCFSFSMTPRHVVSLPLAFSVPCWPPGRASSPSSTRASMYSPRNCSRSAAASPSPLRDARSASRRFRTSPGSGEKTERSRSMPNMPGRKSSSSKTPALMTALLARRQAQRRASTKAPKSGTGFTSRSRSCR